MEESSEFILDTFMELTVKHWNLQICGPSFSLHFLNLFFLDLMPDALLVGPYCGLISVCRWRTPLYVQVSLCSLLISWEQVHAGLMDFTRTVAEKYHFSAKVSDRPGTAGRSRFRSSKHLFFSQRLDWISASATNTGQFVADRACLCDAFDFNH